MKARKVVTAVILLCSLVLNAVLGAKLHRMQKEQQTDAMIDDMKMALVQACQADRDGYMKAAKTWQQNAYRCLADLTVVTDQLEEISGSSGQ